MDTLQPRFHWFHRWTQWGPKQSSVEGHPYQMRRCVRCDKLEFHWV